MASDDWTPVDESTAASGWLDTANDFGRAVTNAATFGMGNRIKGYLSGTGTDEQARLSEVARKRSPIASVAGDVYGSFAIPSLGAGRAAATLGGGALARGAAYGGTGAIIGAAQGAGNTYTGNPMDYVENAGWGAAIGAPLGAAGGAAFGRGPARTSAVTPDAATLAAERTRAYDYLEALPARYTASSLAQRADDVTETLRRQNYYNGPADAGGSPGSFRTTEQLRAPPTAVSSVNGDQRLFVSPYDIDVVRKGVTGDRAAGLSPTDQASAQLVRRGIDDFLQNPPPGAVAPGTEAAARQAASTSRLAHDLHGGFKRTQFMEGMISNAERQAGSTHSGLNLRNELQKAVKNRLAEKEGASQFSRAGFNNAERAELDRFTRGQGRTSQALGYFDKLLGGGGGLGATAAGGVVGGLGGQYLKDEPGAGAALGGAAAATGLGLRLIGNRRAANEINQLRNMIAQRNPLYEARVARAGTQPGTGSPQTAKALRDAIALEVLKMQQQPPEQKYESW